MKRVMLFAIAVGCTAAWNPSATAARYISMEIAVDDTVVLVASTSDDGYPDADSVWRSAGKVAWRQTAEFGKTFGLGPKSEGATMEIGAQTRLAVRVEVRYGGTARTSKVKIVRLPDSAKGQPQWTIAPEELARLFDTRLISRREAAALANPALPKR